MAKANDFKIKVNVKTKEFTNSTSGDKFSSEVLDGYVTFRGSPVLKVSGRRIKDKAHTSQDGRSFVYKKFALDLRRGEDYKDEALKEPGSVFLRIDDKETRDKKRTFRAVNSDSTYYGKDDSRNTKGIRLSTPKGDVLLKLNGIIQSTTTKDQFSDDVNRLTLEIDDVYCKNAMRDDQDLPEGGSITVLKGLHKGKKIPKVGYTWDVEDDLFTEDQLTRLSEQFSNFNRFIDFFEPEVEEVDKVVSTVGTSEESTDVGTFN